MKLTKHEKKVAARLEVVRKIKQRSRQYVADKIGITQQQLQKYEKAQNRITAGRLYDIAAALGVSVHDLMPEGDDLKLLKG